MRGADAEYWDMKSLFSYLVEGAWLTQELILEFSGLHSLIVFN